MVKTSSQALSGNGCMSGQSQRQHPLILTSMQSSQGQTLEWLHGQTEHGTGCVGRELYHILHLQCYCHHARTPPRMLIFLTATRFQEDYRKSQEIRLA